MKNFINCPYCFAENHIHYLPDEGEKIDWCWKCSKEFIVAPSESENIKYEAYEKKE
jgi:DNA-directed RNA polymerase subunit RPC12/RpoP